MTNEVDEFLAHFGVKGMHWGVVREEDSSTGRVKKAEEPSKAETKAAKLVVRDAKRETRGQKFDVKASTLQTQINDLKNQEFKNNFRGRGKSKERDEQVDDLQKLRVRAIKDAEHVRQGKLSSTQKKVVIGASVVVALVAAKVVHENLESGQFRRLAEKGKVAVHGGQAFDFAKKEALANPNLSPSMVHGLVVKDINPDYGKIGTKMNCRRCTFAYELRRRGYDVMATRTTEGNGQNAVGLINALSPGEKIKSTTRSSVMSRITKEQSLKDNLTGTPTLDMIKNFAAGGKNKIDNPNPVNIFRSLSKEPNGSRGEIGVMWKAGGGHSMIYEVFNGKPVIFDGQTGERFDHLLDFARGGYGEIKDAGFTRLDNVPLNTDYLMKWLKNVK